MDIDKAQTLAIEHLLPMFPGSSLQIGKSSSRDAKVAWVGGSQQVSFKLDKSWQQRLTVSRSQSFSPAERGLIDAFVKACEDVDSAIGQAYETEVLRSLGRFVVIESVKHAPSELLGNALATLEHWAVQTYEGREVTAGLGFLTTRDESSETSSVNFEEYRRLDVAKVLGDGVSSLMVFDSTGQVRGLHSLSGGNNSARAPLRFSGAAAWAEENRLSLCLSRRGEILLFTDGELRFARRRGSWIYFDQASTIRRWKIHSTSLRASVYESCLDASFARTGACVAMVTMANSHNVRSLVADEDILASSGDNAKLAALRTIISGRSFQELDRAVRQDLLALDGAVILSHTGAILAAGAIVRVPGGSEGGGRRAAALELSKLGVGLKISSDGGLTAFSNSDVVYAGF
ncbi:hypothetical protein WME89_47785 [Sorangium sp. So ce321]|uniref:hypothetical protein n=1 Tax=Sorangium sp. So ce321 TaxID=3133300 RepID=UPI003F636DD8